MGRRKAIAQKRQRSAFFNRRKVANNTIKLTLKGLSFKKNRDQFASIEHTTKITKNLQRWAVKKRLRKNANVVRFSIGAKMKKQALSVGFFKEKTTP